MDYFESVAANLQGDLPGEALVDDRRVAVQLIRDRTKSSRFIKSFISRYSTIYPTLLLDLADLPVKDKKAISVSYLSSFLWKLIKERKIESMNSLIVHVPKGTHVPCRMILNLLKNQVVTSGSVVRTFRVNNIIIIHSGEGMYHQFSPVACHEWLSPATAMNVKVIPECLLKALY